MIRNYFKIAWRNLWRNRMSSFINIFGLSLGLSACLLIALFIQHEISYDRFELNGKNIYRIIMEYRFNGGNDSQKGDFSSSKVAPTFKRVFPEVEQAIKMTKRERVVSSGNKLFTEKALMFADSNFFRIFSFKMIAGDPSKALAASHQVVVTENTAHKYFGDETAIGRLMKLGNDSVPYRVTGVMQNTPSNSQIKFDFLVSFSSLGEDQQDTYWNANYTTYLLLHDASDPGNLENKINTFMKNEMKDQGADIKFSLEPFFKIHLYSDYAGFEPNNSISYIYILAAVGLLILLIACFTYINLSTSKSLERAREVGVRKVVGAGRKQLFLQFMGESSLLCLLSIIISLVLSWLLLPYFNQLTEKNLHVTDLLNPLFLLFALLVGLLTSFLAGFYPALVLTGFNPVKVLKGSFRNSSSGQTLRLSLVVFQFVISVFLILGTIVIQEQLSYIQNRKLGFEKEHVLVLPVNSSMASRIDLLKKEFTSYPGILSLSRCYSTPVEIVSGYGMRSGTMPSTQHIAVNANPVDEDYIRTTGLEILTGKDFSREDVEAAAVEDPQKVEFHFILNEAAARRLGWSPEEAIGKRMYLDDSRPGYVKAVVRNFNFQSMHTAIKPLVLFPAPQGRIMLAKLDGKNTGQSIGFLQSKWKELIPDIPFEYRFLDQDFHNLYLSEWKLGKLMNSFSVIAVLLACLGLFGLSSYSARQRIKEIGIRKVLGASLGQIIGLLSKKFVLLILLSCLIAIPLGWLVMNYWLNGFAYHISVSAWSLLITALLALSIGFVTVGIQALRAGLLNPVENLKTE